MGKGIHKSAVVPVEASLLSIAILLTSLRLFLRLVLQRSRLTLSDWFLIMSAADAIALFATDVMSYNLGGMDDYDPDAPPKPIPDQISLMKVSFAGNYFYDTGVYFPKMALLALYFRLIPQTMPMLRRALYVVTGLTVSFAVATCFVDTFWCGKNVSVNWDLNGSCSSFDSMSITRIDWSMNILSDLMIFSLPFPILWGLRVTRTNMIGLVATFCSGLITVATSVSRYATIESIHAWTNVYVLSMTELVAAIVVVCLPSLRSLVHRAHVGSSNRGTGTGTTTGNGYRTYTGSSHIKLSSGLDPYATTTRITTVEAAAAEADSGSEVELSSMQRQDVIYKSERISVTYEGRNNGD